MKNAVILNKDARTWPRIKKYFEERGVDTSALTGDAIGKYYGVIEDRFWLFTFEQVQEANSEIIELPEESAATSIPTGKSLLGLTSNQFSELVNEVRNNLYLDENDSGRISKDTSR